MVAVYQQRGCTFILDSFSCFSESVCCVFALSSFILREPPCFFPRRHQTTGAGEVLRRTSVRDAPTQVCPRHISPRCPRRVLSHFYKPQHACQRIHMQRLCFNDTYKLERHFYFRKSINFKAKRTSARLTVGRMFMEDGAVNKLLFSAYIIYNEEATYHSNAW